VGEQKIDVDGETYWVKRLRPMEASRFLVRCIRFFGPSVRSLALSDNAPGFIQAVLGSDAPGKVLAEKLKGGDFSVLTLIYNASDDLDEEKLVELIDLALVGQVSAMVGGEKCGLDDLATYETVVGKAIEKHGPFHQMKLLWAAIRVNLGPISGGGGTNPPPASATPE
jgi:hypothetical protein